MNLLQTDSCLGGRSSEKGSLGHVEALLLGGFGYDALVAREHRFRLLVHILRSSNELFVVV